MGRRRSVRGLCRPGPYALVLVWATFLSAAGPDAATDLRGDFQRLTAMRDGLLLALQQRQAADRLAELKRP